MNLNQFIKSIQGALQTGGNDIKQFAGAIGNAINPQYKSPMHSFVNDPATQNQAALHQQVQQSNQQLAQNNVVNKGINQQLTSMQGQMQPQINEATTNANLIHKYLAGAFSEPGSQSDFTNSGSLAPQVPTAPTAGQVTQQQVPQAYLPQVAYGDIMPNTQPQQALTANQIRQSIPQAQFQQGGQG